MGSGAQINISWLGGDWLSPLQDHTFNFGWGCAPNPTGAALDLAGWVGARSPSPRTHTPDLGPSGLDGACFPDPTILAPKPKSQTAYVPKDATLSSPELVPPIF